MSSSQRVISTQTLPFPNTLSHMNPAPNASVPLVPTPHQRVQVDSAGNVAPANNVGYVHIEGTPVPKPEDVKITSTEHNQTMTWVDPLAGLPAGAMPSMLPPMYPPDPAWVHKNLGVRDPQNPPPVLDVKGPPPFMPPFEPTPGTSTHFNPDDFKHPAEVLKDPNARSIKEPLSDAERSADYISLALPSNFLFYPFKRLSARLVTARHQAKFLNASKQGSLRLAVEAVTSCLGDGVSALDLTIPDFFYVLLWLRLASYTTFDMNQVVVCNNVKHLAAVAEGKKSPETLKTLHVVKQTNIEERTLTTMPVLPAILQASGLRVSVPRMRDTCDMDDFLSDLPDGEKEEASHVAAIACMIDPVQYEARWTAGAAAEAQKVSSMTFAERFKVADRLNADMSRALINDWDTAINGSYGVTESITVKCKECGADVRTEIRISALNFS